ncbi:MAG: cell division protein FtsQ/DivIB [Pseudomonadales bacterium]
MISRSLSVLTVIALVTFVGQSSRAVWDYVAGPLDLVRVEGDLSDAERKIVVAAVNDVMSTGDVVNVRDIRDKVTNIDWIRAVTVRRNWPNSVHVTVNRELPTARWGFDSYLNSKGNVLSMAQKYPFDLPIINAATTDSSSSMKLFKTFSALVERSGLRIVELDESSVAGWTVTFANGLSVALGTTGLLNRLRRFVRVYEEVLRGNEEHVVRADARYPSGVAIEWDGESSTLLASRGL